MWTFTSGCMVRDSGRYRYKLLQEADALSPIKETFFWKILAKF